jgi:hypothetical protein
LTLCIVWSPPGGGDDARLAGALRRPDLETLACDEEFSVIAALAAGGAAKRTAILLLVEPAKLFGLGEVLDAAQSRVQPLVVWVFDPAGKPVLREATPDEAKALASTTNLTAPPRKSSAPSTPTPAQPAPLPSVPPSLLPALQPSILGPALTRTAPPAIVAPPLHMGQPAAPEWIGASSTTSQKFSSLPPSTGAPPAVAPTPKLRLAGEGELPPKPDEQPEGLGEPTPDLQPLLTDEELAMLLGEAPPQSPGNGRERPGNR